MSIFAQSGICALPGSTVELGGSVVLDMAARDEKFVGIGPYPDCIDAVRSQPQISLVLNSLPFPGSY